MDDKKAFSPKWRRVLDDLEQRLVDGEFTDRFPTDRELVERYGVSRQTVREAVRHLKMRGIVERSRGRGSKVTQAEFVQPMGTLYSLFRAVEAQGLEQTSEVLSRDWKVDPWAAERLGVDDGERLFHLERIRYAGGIPLALDTVWLPHDVGQVLMDVDFTHTALYDELEARAGLRPTSGEEAITAIVADEALRESLDLGDDEAVLRMERVGRTGERAIECRVTLVRASRFNLVSRWPRGGAVAPQIVDDELTV